MKNDCIALLFGGAGAEHRISCRSAAAILPHLSPICRRILRIGITRRGAWFLYRGSPERIADGTWSSDRADLTPTFPVRIGARRGFLSPRGIARVDAVFPALHGDFGEDGRIQGLFDTVGIPYVGCDCLCGAICADKELTKRLAASIGIPVVPYLSLTGEEGEDAAVCAVQAAFGGAHPFPLFVKPASRGSSIGAAIATDLPSLRRAYQAARRHGKVLVERFLPSVRELECAFLDAATPIVTHPGEIRSAADFYDYREKYDKNRASVQTRAALPPDVADAVRRDSMRLLRLLGCRDLCRIDWFYTPNGSLYFNEINTFPGFTDISLYPRLIGATGIAYDDLIGRLVSLAVHRHS